MLIGCPILCGSLLLLYLFARKRNLANPNNDFDRLWFFIFGAAFIVGFVFIMTDDSIVSYFTNFSMWTYLNVLFLISLLFFFGWSIYCLVKLIAHKEVTLFDLIMITFVGFLCATQYGSCTSGGVGEGQGAMTIGLFFALVYFLARQMPFVNLHKLLLSGGAIVFCFSCFGRVDFVTYNWWGLLQGSYNSQTSSITGIDDLKGIKVDENTKEMLEGVVSTVTSDLNDEDTVYCFGQIPIFYSLTNRLPQNTKCVVSWFDVSSQSQLADDLASIEAEPPKYLIVSRIPEGVIEGHESAFNNGEPYVQRDFYTYFDAEIANGTYVVACQYNLNEGLDGVSYPIQVLKLTV
jgi:hypothetical protein